MNFLRGFFTNKAAEYAPEYIRSLEKELTPDEKRYAAGALSAAGLYRESIRLLVSCLNDGSDFSRHDFESLYPRPYREYVEKYAHETSIEPELLYGLIHTESAFQSAVVSSAGAVGLTQLMPSTAAEMISRIHRQGGPDYSGADALRDPEANIHIGAYYLSYLTNRMGSPLLALLAYNGGMNRIRRWRNVDTSLSEDLFLESIEFSETREYGRKVRAAQSMYKALYYEK
jgi:soluble lytic murein transglycosylase